MRVTASHVNIGGSEEVKSCKDSIIRGLFSRVDNVDHPILQRSKQSV